MRIASAFRRHGLDEVAAVWCYHPAGGRKQYPRYYPGDEYVDWWAIHLFSPSHFTEKDAIAFVEEADARLSVPLRIRW